MHNPSVLFVFLTRIDYTKCTFKNKIWMVEGLEAELVLIINDAETLH